MKYIVNFNAGYIITSNLKVKKLYVCEKGIYFRTLSGKKFINEENCKVVY